MDKQVLKTIIGGALIGALIFWAPWFALKVAIVLMIFGFLSRMFWGRRHVGRHRKWVYADKIRSMSEEEYEAFKQKYSGRYGSGDQSKNEKTAS